MSPPMPQPVGSPTHSTALAAIAASVALPPCFRIDTATCVATGWLVAAMPFLPKTSERVAKKFPVGRS